VSPNARRLPATLVTAGIMGMALAYNPVSRAFDFSDMMNPGKWMGSNRDRNDGYHGRPYAGPWGNPYGRGPWGGHGPVPYGSGPYGMPGYPGAVPSPVRTKPTTKAPAASAAGSSEIDALKRRIRELESQQQQQPPAPLPTTGARRRQVTGAPS